MIRVAIETSTPMGSVAVARGGAVLGSESLGVQRRHAEQALPALDRILAAAGVEREEIGGVVVGSGPGSFTGVRVAGSTAKGLVAALEVPLLAYPSLLALAVEAAGLATGESPSGRPICALFDARRGEVFGGCWVVGEERVEERIAPMVAPLGRVLEAASPHDPIYAALNPDRLGMAGRADVRESEPTARALLWLADRHPSLGLVSDPGAWEPEYVRASSAERGVEG